MFIFLKQKFFSSSAPIILWAVFIFVGLSIPMPPYEGNKITYYDKFIHLFLFGFLAFLLAQFLWLKTSWPWPKILMVSFLLTSFYSVALEFWQLLIPGRDSSELDSLAGVIGIIIFLGLASLWPKRPRLLLHICCAGCGAYVSQILSPFYALTLYYYNPNIWPPDEYKARLKEVKRIANIFGLPLIVGGYDHQAWLKLVAGHEQDPEKGERCRICYRDRLTKTALKAKALGFNCFSTTLTISPHKDAKAISAIGQELQAEIGIKFLDRDFKKKDGFKKSVALSRQLNITRQNYCGCEFSRR